MRPHSLPTLNQAVSSARTPFKVTYAQDCGSAPPSLAVQLDTTMEGNLNVRGMDVGTTLTGLRASYLSTLEEQTTAWTLTGLMRLESHYGPRFIPTSASNDWLTHWAISSAVTGFRMFRDYYDLFFWMICLTSDPNPTPSNGGTSSPAHCDGLAVYLNAVGDSYSYACSKDEVSWNTPTVSNTNGLAGGGYGLRFHAFDVTISGTTATLTFPGSDIPSVDCPNHSASNYYAWVTLVPLHPWPVSFTASAVLVPRSLPLVLTLPHTTRAPCNTFTSLLPVPP